MAGRVRPLVPFFVPTTDGSIVVNDALQPAIEPAVSSDHPPTAPLVELSVRTWDTDAGVFRDAVQVVRDLPRPAPTAPAVAITATHATKPVVAVSSSPSTLSSPPPKKKPTPTRLLTPAEIRQKRRAARAASSSPKSDHANTIATPSPSPSRRSDRPARTESPDRPNRPTDKAASPTKPRPFAGSTFEAASPPPGGLPIPSFVRRGAGQPADPQLRSTSSTLEMDPDAMEKAALELRRMLRI